MDIPTDVKDIESNTGLLSHILQFLDVVTLVKTKQVNKRWKELCTKAIDNKCTTPPTPFQSKDSLEDAIRIYCQNHSLDMERIARTYGYPIGKWDVSQITDFSCVFDDQYNFNENINGWDTSNATSMREMFCSASVFNQDISSWNTSKVQDMSSMFHYASSFNQDISSWDTSNVKNMDEMFRDALTFNHDISTWNTAKVKTMMCMICGASAFEQAYVHGWDTSSVEDGQGMFDHFPSPYG